MSTIATTDTGDFAFQNGDIYLIAGLGEVIQNVRAIDKTKPWRASICSAKRGLILR